MPYKKGETVVFIPVSGIGDVIFHLRHIRAIARIEGPITLVTKSRTMTKEWLDFDSAIRRIIYVDDLRKDLFPLLFTFGLLSSKNHGFFTKALVTPFFLIF